MSIFDHTNVALPDDATFGISPSGIGNFFSSPVLWYREHVLGEKQFVGSTSSVLGTLVHYVAEQYALDKPVDRTAINTELDAYHIEDVELDKPLIKELYPEMSMALINEFIRYNKPTEVETSMYTKVLDTVYVKGTADALIPSGNGAFTVVDYKTAAKKPSEKIPFGYLIQSLAYAYMYHSKGVEIDRICIAYAVRPTKTLPIRIIPIYHMITEDDWKLIEDTLILIAESVLTAEAKPELTHLLFKSMNLKE